MTVWVLMVIAITKPYVGPISIERELVVFESAARCLRNIDNVKKQLETKYDIVDVRCSEQKINKDLDK